MITVEAPQAAIRMSYLPAVLHQKDAIRAMAAQLVAGQVEGTLDLIQDCREEYSSFKAMEDLVLESKEAVVDYVEDLLTEFRDELLRQISKVDIKLNSVILKRDGEIDADVVVRAGE